MQCLFNGNDIFLMITLQYRLDPAEYHPVQPNKFQQYKQIHTPSLLGSTVAFYK